VTAPVRPPGFEEVLDAARRLPVCDRAAKLHALIARLQDAVDQGTATAEVADALAASAIDALVDDPWVQFEAAVRRFKAAQELPIANRQLPIANSRSPIPDP
jgi:hypothetical protein